MRQSDVLIVGGGIIGIACARALAMRGTRVEILDAGRLPGAATWAAAGMLAPFAEAEAEDAFLSLCVRARDLYLDLAPALLDDTGIDIGLRTDGILQAAFTDEEVSTVKDLVAWQRQRGFAVDWLAADEVRALVPGIGPDLQGAAYAPEDGALDPAALHDALGRSAQRRGARLTLNNRVEELLIGDGQVHEVRSGTTVRSAGTVLIAAGCWSGRLHGLPRPLPVEPVRGQMAGLVWPANEPPAIIYGAGGYVMERAGEAIAGSTMERAGFDPSVTKAGQEHVVGAMRRILPALADAPVTRTWAGLRPLTPDGHPIIGQDPEVANLWYATGHGRNGILLAALTGDLLAQLITGESVEHDLSAVAPDRFEPR